MSELRLAFALPDEVLALIAERAAALVDTRRRFVSNHALAERLCVSERTIRTWREHGLPEEGGLRGRLWTGRRVPPLEDFRYWSLNAGPALHALLHTPARLTKPPCLCRELELPRPP